MRKALSILAASIITLSISGSVSAESNYSVRRISGKDRYETSINISKEFSKDKVKNIIISSGSNFPDALCGSTLSKRLDAPILLVGKNINESVSSINYIKDHLESTGTIYILGGNGSVNEEFEKYFQTLKYKIKRLYGTDRFETNTAIVDSLNINKNSPIVIVNGYSFPDALSISSIAATKGYPILLSNTNYLPTKTKNLIKNIQPSKIYMIGGESSLSSKLEEEIESLVPTSTESIVRLGGINRYETSLNVCKYFVQATDSVFIANGESFPDALSGSALAAKLNVPIILTDGSNIITQKRYLDNLQCKKLVLLGGKCSVSEAAENILKETDKMLFYINSSFEQNSKKYIQGYFVKFVTDLEEAKEYEKRTGNIVIANDHDGTGDYIPDDGFDMPISNTVTLDISENVKITELTFGTLGNISNVDSDFNSIINRKYESRPIFNIKLKNGIVTDMIQEYRP